MLTPPIIEQRITEQVRQILSAGGKSDAALTADLSLADGLGLDSLELAGLFIALEDEFQVDLFGGDVSITDMRSIADLTRAYAALLGESAAAA